MRALPHGGEEDPAGPHDGADELQAMLSEIAEYAQVLPAGSSPLIVDSAEIAGSNGQAQENRGIRLARARYAAERAGRARQGLHELATRARAASEELRAVRVLREARLELTAAERRRLAELWSVVPPVAGAPRPRGLVGELLAHVCAIDGVAHAGITMWDRRRAVAWAEASDDVARALSIVQSVTGGPGRDAADTASSVYSSSRPDEERAWGPFSDAAADLGVRAVLAVPLHVGDRVGSLDLYTCRPAGLGEPSRELGRLLGRYAAIALRRHVLAAAPPPVGTG